MSKKYDFPENKLEDALRRAFVDKGLKQIVMDGYEFRNTFLRQAVEYGLKKGIIRFDRESGSDEAQYTVFIYPLTEKGREHFGLR